MRTDVKWGIAASMAIVLLVGGYFVFSGGGEPAILVADNTASTAPAKPDPAKAAAPSKARQVHTNKDPGVRPAVPTNSQPAKTPQLANRPTNPPPSVTLPINPNVGTSPPVTLPTPSAASTSTGPTTPIEPKSDNATAPPSGPSVPVPGLVEKTNPAPVPSSGAELPAASPTGASERVMSAPLTGTPTSMALNSPVISPARKDSPAAAVDKHKVQPGDSLASLAQTYYGNAKYAKFLADSNSQLAGSTRLAVGSTLQVPPLPADLDTRNASPPAAGDAKSAVVAKGGKRTYKVQPGDSFYRIAREQLGSPARWKELFALNKSAVHGDPTQLQVGQTLLLPES